MVVGAFLVRLTMNYFEIYSLLSSDTETKNIITVNISNFLRFVKHKYSFLNVE